MVLTRQWFECMQVNVNGNLMEENVMEQYGDQTVEYFQAVGWYSDKLVKLLYSVC